MHGSLALECHASVLSDIRHTFGVVALGLRGGLLAGALNGFDGRSTWRSQKHGFLWRSAPAMQGSAGAKSVIVSVM
ncbi:hypothetical protein [Lysobacter sp. cf310]|uniref:hypothetical protein n=1 Tax=Lysobacter sp. cf310 TaxID=1761790 RepID=UPI001113C9FC|nr:hypothetical protein [Lysobacter sp. cf310]